MLSTFVAMMTPTLANFMVQSSSELAAPGSSLPMAQPFHDPTPIDPTFLHSPSKFSLQVQPNDPKLRTNHMDQPACWLTLMIQTTY